MIRMQLVTVVAVGLVATGCTYNSTTQAVVPAGPLTASEQACLDYGFTPGTGAYERCVGREIDARRYREEAYVAPVSTTVVYTTPAPAYAYVPPVPPQPPAGVQAFRDEYGFRYDGQGNRIDARGNIISPHSTAP